MDRILTAKDAAQSLGYNSSSRLWIIEYSAHLFSSRQVRFQCSGETMKRYSVYARIDAGRWVADCHICSRSNYVDPADPVFYCFGCGNQGSGCFVPVIFPEEIHDIEALLLARPVSTDQYDVNPISQAINAHPLFPSLIRSWTPEQSVQDLRDMNLLMESSDG